MMHRVLLIVLSFLLLASCHKKKTEDPVEDPVPIVPFVPDTGLKCQALPAAPGPFGWNDSITNEQESITAFLKNPLNTNEFICLVKGDITGYNQLFTYNVITKNKIPLANLGNFLPSVNKNGWIVFSSVDNNLFRVKSNGDSLIQITYNKTCLDPKWDATGKAIYYFQQAYSNILSGIVKLSISGPPSNITFPADLPYHAVFRKSDQVIYLKTAATEVSLVQKNLITQAERYLVSGPYNPKSETVYFSNLCLDNNDENFFWSNSLGIFKCNLATLKIDTVLKSCPNYSYTNPLMPLDESELTLSMQVLKPLENSVLLHEYKAMKYDLVYKTLSEVRIFQ
ncbi:MAG: hypothetical protein PSX36_01115 [bacterium]|nr:hypothetical protein [bacterium]